jgi:hypothetical protein
MARRRSPDLSPEAIQNLTPLEVEQLLLRLGVTIDQQAMFDAADALYARAGAALRAGHTDLDPSTWAMLEGQVERAYNDLLRKQLKAVVRDIRMSALADASRKGGASRFIWIATLSGTCQSCLDRHGETLSMDEWEQQGLPGAPVLLCNGNCNCQLLPFAADDAEEEVYLNLLGALDDDLGVLSAPGDLAAAGPGPVLGRLRINPGG